MEALRKVKLAVGRDGRNRTVLWSFAAKTSRTQPKASQWIFSPAVWLRFLIKPEPGMALAYIDYSSAEFMIGASMSDGHCGPVNNMMDLYSTFDWPVLCAEVAKLNVKLVERAKVLTLPLPLAMAVGDAEGDREGEGGFATPLATPARDHLKIAVGDEFRRRDSNPDKRHQKPLSCL